MIKLSMILMLGFFLPFIMSSTVVGLQGVQVQLVPDRGGEVGGLPWHYAEDNIMRDYSLFAFRKAKLT